MSLKNIPKKKVSLIWGMGIILFCFVLGLFYIYKDQRSSYIQTSPTATSTVETTTPIGVATSTSPSSTNGKGNNPPPNIPPVENIGHAIGIAAGSSLTGLSTSTLNAELDGMVKLGVTWVRFDIQWGHVQYDSSSTYNWKIYDRIMDAVLAHNLKPLAVITYTAPWARVPSCTNGVECPPSNPVQFATFAAAVVARYSTMGANDWEIWNEPNNGAFWGPKANCSAYTTLLKTTYPAIKAVDPNAIVLTGGLAPETTAGNNIAPLDFLKCIYANGGEGYFDAVSDHPYTYPGVPSATGSNSWAQMSTTMLSLRSIMVANGDAAKKIWLTEYGAPTNGPDPKWYVSEASQTQMMIDAFQLYETYSWAGPLFWYTYQDGGTSTDTNENFFGLVRADGSQKPAYSTMQTLISEGL